MCYAALCADYYETLAPTGLDKNTFACFCMRPALPGELYEIFALPGELYEIFALPGELYGIFALPGVLYGIYTCLHMVLLL